MSGGPSCPYRIAHWRLWRVSARRVNHSAFNGYRATPSAYSEIMCLECRGRWRTRAAYVSAVPDATPEDWEIYDAASAKHSRDRID